MVTKCLLWQLSSQVIRQRKTIKYSKPVIWNAPKNHAADCNFCNTVFPTGQHKDRRQFITYPDPNTVFIVRAVLKKNRDGAESSTQPETPISMDFDIDIESTEATTSAQMDVQSSTSAGIVSPSIFPTKYKILNFDSSTINSSN